MVNGLGEDIIEEELESVIEELAKAVIADIIDEKLAAYRKELQANYGIDY